MNEEQLERYTCTTLLKEVGEVGQQTLLSSAVLIIGVGGLGSSALMSLASLGIGTIGIVDDDVVKRDNLPRQLLYGVKDIGKFKVDAAKRRIKGVNPDVKIKSHKVRLTQLNAVKIIKKYDVILDCTDNFKSKFLIEDICQKLHKPYVIPGVSDYKGQVMSVNSESKYIFKSLFDDPCFEIPEKYIEEDKAVFPLAVSLISNIATAEVVKLILKIGEPLIDKMLFVDTLKMKFEIIKFR